MNLLPLIFALVIAPSWCETRYSVTYAPAELSSDDGMRGVLQRLETVAQTYCAEHLPGSSPQLQRLCRYDVVTELASKVDHAEFRDLVTRSQHDLLTNNGPVLM